MLGNTHDAVGSCTLSPAVPSFDNFAMAHWEARVGFLRKSKGFVNNASALVRKKSETYAPLSAPTMDGVAIPNLRALSSGPDRETINLLVEFARSQFETLGANGIELKYPGSTQLRSSLVDSFSDGRPELGTEIDKALSVSIPGGWLIGEMNHESKIWLVQIRNVVTHFDFKPAN